MFYENGSKVQIFVPEEMEGQRLLLRGRVLRIRDKGKLIWLDIMFEGKIYQAFFNDTNEELLVEAKKLTSESVVSLLGKLIKKPSANENIDFGQHELVVEKVVYMSVAEPLPFNPHFEEAGDATSQLYRFLSLRKKDFYKNLKNRSRITNIVRNYLAEDDFLEIETPTLVKSTPEGARDFLVPSRIHPGEFYALPQSPQLYKQVLMQSGFEKYFQIARCYRDEALRGDRQLEFTQIDVEAAFFTQKNMQDVVTEMITNIFSEMGKELVWDAMWSYKDAMYYFGNDKPDLRFEIPINHEAGGIFLFVKKNMTGKERSNIFDWVKSYVLTLRMGHDVPFSIWSSTNIEKLQKENEELFNNIDPATKEYTIFFIKEESDHTIKLMGELRNYIGRTFLLPENCPHVACWVHSFPMFEYSEEQLRHLSMHHPFTRPTNIEEFEKDPYNALADAYDLVIDGVEVGGGSVRIHEPELQKKVFELLGLTDYEEKFGGLLKAYKYGAVPHAGLALGLDRLCTFFGESNKIGDYIAFPKNMSGHEAMFNSPSTVEESQLKELHIGISIEEENKTQ